jgi:DNA-binding beta-propeller fold protein YncE
MRRFPLVITTGLALVAVAQQSGIQVSANADGPYHVLKTTKVGGDGGFDYVYADSVGRRLYIARGGTTPRINVFNLDTLEPAGEIAKTSARGAAVDVKSHHGFSSSRPMAMWDSNTMALIKTIDVEGGPDGILDDPFNQRVYVFSHRAPNATVIDAKDGSVLGTIDLGGAPEQAVTDGKGHIYVDLEDKDSIAVVDAKTMKMTGTYSLNGKGGGPGGLAIDVKNHLLFASCHNPQTMVILDANNGKVLADLPIGQGTDGATFNPKTMEAFSSNGDGTLTVIKEDGPGKFSVEQNVKTMPGAKTLTLDSKTNQILLIAAEFGAAPAPATPGGRQRRGPMVPGSFSIIVVGK